MLTQKHIQFVSLALVLVTAAAGLAVPMAVSSPQERAEPHSCLYSAEASPVFVLSGSSYRSHQSLFFHALNASFSKRPAAEPHVYTLNLDGFSGDIDDSADHPTLFALSCMLTV